MIICRTPFRISFFGGGTDYSAWYRTHGGSVLAATVDKYCYLMERLQGVGEIRVKRLGFAPALATWPKNQTRNTPRGLAALALEVGRH